MMIKIKNISTEALNKKTENIDILPTKDQVKMIINEDSKITNAISKEIDNISLLIDKVKEIVSNGANIYYIGAGTSGRIGILDASEILPTFGEKGIFKGIIAGGKRAIEFPVENVEDNKEQAIKDLKSYNISSKDMIIGLTASGRTPYVISALKYAKSKNIITGSIATSLNSEISHVADFPIEVAVGPETIVGSTRMKSGTVQKMLLNMISTLSMVNYGKVYKNLMVDVVATNEKLFFRSISMFRYITSASYDEAKNTIDKAGGSVKIAIVMYLKKLSKNQAIKILNEKDGKLREIL